jgi:PD-(D/E)XK nuclease superfamily
MVPVELAERRGMSDNVFQVLGIQSREDCVSNAIAYAFNSCTKFRESFLRIICEKQPDDYSEIKALTRVSIAGYGTPDLVIVCTSDMGTDLILIENKLAADEGEDQTTRYASEPFRELLRRKLCPDKPTPKWTFIFLTLFPDQEAASQDFRHKSYELLAGTVSKYAHPDSLAETLMRDWLALLDRFYKKRAVQPSDDVLEKLQDEDGLGSGYLYFREALRQLQLPPSLQIDDFFRSSQQGRYGAIISKGSWHPAEMDQHNSDLWNLDPLQNFHIHFEPQFDVLNHVLKLYLHYEVYPYQPEAWVRQHVPSSQYDEYVLRRTSFFDRLRERAPQGWNFGMGYNQIAGRRRF